MISCLHTCLGAYKHKNTSITKYQRQRSIDYNFCNMASSGEVECWWHWHSENQENQIKKIEILQSRSSRFIKYQYSREPGSVTNILKDLRLPSLEIRRKIKRVCLFHKAVHHQIAINIPDYIYTNYTGQPDNITHGISKMYKYPVTLINTASFLGPSRTGILYHQSFWIYIMLRH